MFYLLVLIKVRCKNEVNLKNYLKIFLTVLVNFHYLRLQLSLNNMLTDVIFDK